MHNCTGVYNVQFVEDLPGKGTPVGGIFLFTINLYAKFTSQLTHKRCTIVQECTMYSSWNLPGKGTPVGGNFLCTLNSHAPFTTKLTQLTYKRCTILQECTMYSSWRICRGKGHRLAAFSYSQ